MAERGSPLLATMQRMIFGLVPASVHSLKASSISSRTADGKADITSSVLLEY
jgi:hypothetical protein